MIRIPALPAALCLLLASCVATGGTPDERRSHIDGRTQDVLSRLYDEVPASRKQVEGAAGFAVFSNKGVDLFFVGGGGGYGVAVDNDSGDRTYMRMGEAGVGIGLGVKDFRVVFVFEDRDRLETFIREGWDVGVDATAAASLEGEGAEASAVASFQDGIAAYQLTETGLALRANLKGTKYWAYTELN